MISVPSLSAINRIEIFSRWVGFAVPPSISAKVTITNAEDSFVRQLALEATSDELPERVLSRLVKALARPAILCLDTAIFDYPPAAIERHYCSCWSSDYPSHLIRIHCDTERHITIRSNNQHAFMLPLKITDSVTDEMYETFDPELSRALADLMPEGYLDRERLAGRLGMLELDREEAEHEKTVTETADESSTALTEANDKGNESTFDAAKFDEDVFQILFGGESAQDTQEADHSHRLSERLLRRNSLETARNLLAQGADPSIADDVGQTALMHAAFPPFDRERFRLLVEAGADLEARRNGLTGLHLACAGGEAQAAAEWVRAGADISARSPGNATPLMLGATWPHVVHTLINERADANAVDDDGHSPIVYAILGQRDVSADGQLDAMQVLIDAGADVNLIDFAGVSPLGHATTMLAAAILEEEVIRAFNPEANLTVGSDWNRRKLAEAFVSLLVIAGARD